MGKESGVGLTGYIPMQQSLCCAESFQSCPTMCSPMDCSPPGSSVHGILQERIHTVEYDSAIKGNTFESSSNEADEHRAYHIW